MALQDELPPKIPDELKRLERAVDLLGSRAKYELSPKLQRELAELLGAYPDSKRAVLWKAALKGLATDMRELGVLHHEDSTPTAPRRRIVTLKER